MRIAIVHYWLIGMRGGEKVIESLCRLYPQADIFTHCVDKDQLSPLLKNKTIYTTFINSLPFATRYYKYYLPLMPLALEQLDLRGYDLIISSESGPAKGLIVHSSARHICYCHTPMRYLWDCYHTYLENKGIVTRTIIRPIFHYLRMWDISSAVHPDIILANSHTVAQRVQRCWGRSASVIYPPVELDLFKPTRDVGDYYLCFGQLVEYKRVDLAIKVASETGRKLIVAGDGDAYTKLKQLAGPSVIFIGKISMDERAKLLAGCRALLFPGEEDFGIVPIEAMASGRPVIAYSKGGASETVSDGITGFFFHEQTPEALLKAIEYFEKHEHTINTQQLVKHASKFSETQFHQAFSKVVDNLCASKDNIQ
ncbi:glycosyltransferase [Lawsonia intracellularis]|uniref:Glycosyltransferase n=1 Tax=Lawsonia intracellularis (strain PHE/MN1-00) TaxID=363253 RepID=Q1MR09_LAWIP|nr:glycosyltransferase [Lawsonia intracellularis]AGC49927.1 glycosyltransferase [Lawsonia intracellularis N343]KAA0205425.1 glycosyltransferase family 4 protein [Lawsonia intracellularis]MBZ3892035.1 glycosyltransferase [Lawsonia intracellularis]OMQ04688.1 glycosyl transferase [Lawsonia intracellularis]RBN32026.1 glycosyltransferase family 4 protein [Lawsonia intracellularis]